MRFERPTGLMLHHFHGSGHPRTQGSISAAEFESILDFLSEDHTFLPAQDWREKALSGTLTPTDVCITLDDALACQYDVAGPVLERRGLTAFWFVYTSVLEGGIEPLEIFRLFRTTHFQDIDAFYDRFFDRTKQFSPQRYADAQEAFDPQVYLSASPFYTGNDRWFRYLRDVMLSFPEYRELMFSMMEEEGFSAEDASQNLWLTQTQVKALSDAGHVIGLHSHTHPTALAKLSAAEQRREYEQNSASLSAVLGYRPDCMSHPCNSYSGETLDILRSLGVRIGFRANRSPVSARSDLEFDREDHANICSLLKDRDQNAP